MSRAAASRTPAATKITLREKARIALAIVASLAAAAATSGIIALITMLPAEDLEVITGLIGLMK